MNFGDCPYDDCSGRFFEPIPDRTPAWALLTCDTCARPVWYKFSRFDPEAYTLDDFNAEYIVDEETKSIRQRVPDARLSPLAQKIGDALAVRYLLCFEHMMLFGIDHECVACGPLSVDEVFVAIDGEMSASQ